MTRDQIVDGLSLLVMQLANDQDSRNVPNGWQPHEWAYLKGIASHAILRARALLIELPRGTSETSGGVSQT